MATNVSKDLLVLTSEDFQDILNIIYVTNCCHKPAEIRAKIVTLLKRAFQAKGVAFFLGDSTLEAIDNTNLVSIGIDRRYLKKYDRYYCNCDPFRQEIHSRETVCKVDDILPYSQWIKLKIYNEFYREQNIHYKLSIFLRSNAGILGLIGIFRSENHEDFSEREKAKARILAPCLASALESIHRIPGIYEVRNLSIECVSDPELRKYQLTKREAEIVLHVCQGLTNNEIADRLSLSRLTVETHLKNIFSKTMIKHRAGLASLLRSN